MSRSVRRFDVSPFYSIECVTEINNSGSKVFTVSAVFLPFEEYFETYSNITDKDEANEKFIMLKERYRRI